MFLLRAGLRGVGGRLLAVRPATSLGAPTLGAPSLTSRATPAMTDVRLRPLSSSSSGGGKDDDDSSFFLKDEESLPPPPTYVRDAVTGKWTDETRATLSNKEKQLLSMDGEGREEEAMKRLEDRWRKAAEDADGEEGVLGFRWNEEHERVAGRIEEQKLALGTIGRAPSAAKKTGDDDDDDAAAPELEKKLSAREFQALKTYAQKEKGVDPRDFARLTDDDPDLIPHASVASGGEGSADSRDFFDADLDLSYLNPRLNRKAFADEGAAGDDPFADLLPSDLNPARKVNRRHAKPIPRRLLHHNNLSLLRRYTTPGGKIMNRVQSRLGAKDQRKIAKLVKRARHLGLIPHLGQWKFEDHGLLHEEGLAEADRSTVGEDAEGKRDWEAELERRGLWPLRDENEVTRRHYGVEKMMDRMAGPRGSKKRKELEELLGGEGDLVPGEAKEA